MRSTGEVLGMDREPAAAFLRAQEAAGIDWPAAVRGGVLFAVAERDIEAAAEVARTLAKGGARLYAAGRSARAFAEECAADVQIVDGGESDSAGIPEVLAGAFGLVVQTDDDDRRDGAALRRAALEAGVSCVTSIPAARFGASAAAGAGERSGVRSLQEWMQRES